MSKRKREDEEELMRHAMSSPRVEIVPGLWRRIVRGRRSRNDAKPWTCSCGFVNNPTQHLFFDLPRFKCKRKGCKEIIPENYEFQFSLADIEANGICPLGNVKDQEHRPHCMAYSSATNAEATERITRIFLEEKVNGKGPMICMKTLIDKLRVRKQIRKGDFENDYSVDLGLKDFRRIHAILEGGVKVTDRSHDCRISGTLEVPEEFSLVCKDLAEGYPLLAIIRTGKGFHNLKWNEIYKPPKKSAIVMGKAENLHCILLLGGGMRKNRKMYYKYVNTYGMDFCPLSNLKIMEDLDI